MVDRIIEFYNFESDNESHINGEELSDLSDEFDDDFDTVDGNSSQRSTTRSQSSRDQYLQNPTSTLAIDDIPYDRDLKWINVPTTARPKVPQQVLYNPNQNRLFKQVNEITKSNAQELKDLDDHYRKLDERKKVADQKYERSFPDRKQKPFRKEDRFGRGGGGNAGGRFNENRGRDERRYMESEMYQGEPYPDDSPYQQQQQPPQFSQQDRRFDGGKVGPGPREGFRDPMDSPHDRYHGLHPLHHQHNHRNNSRRRQGERFPNDYPSYGSSKLAKNISANQQHHDDQVRHARGDEVYTYPEPHPLRDYYDHSPHDFRQSNDFPASSNNDDYQNYAYQAPLGGYVANQFRRTPPPQQSPSTLANSTFSAQTATSSNTSPGGLNPFAQEFVPSFMLR